jgi:hypothetical protein
MEGNSSLSLLDNISIYCSMSTEKYLLFSISKRLDPEFGVHEIWRCDREARNFRRSFALRRSGIFTAISVNESSAAGFEGHVCRQGHHQGHCLVPTKEAPVSPRYWQNSQKTTGGSDGKERFQGS